MSPTRQRTIHLHHSGQVIRSTADHPFYVEGKGWINAADMPGAHSEGEQEVVYNLGEQAMPHFPIIGFTAGTPILTADGMKRIEDIKPGDMIQVQPDDHQGDDELRWWEQN